MERNSTNENFEHFLRQNAEEYRMRPSSKVWEGIADNLSKRKRRFYLGLLALLISSSILGYTILDLSFVKIAETVSPVTKPSVPAIKNSLNKTSSLPLTTKAIENLEFDILAKTGSPNQSVLQLPISLNNNPTERSSNKNVPGIDYVDNNVLNSSQNYKEGWMANLLASTSGVSANQSNNFLSIITTKENPFDFSNLNANPTEENPDLLVQQRKKPGKFGMMIYFTPTVSYRKLSENKSYIRAAGAVPLTQLQDINNAVTHKPNIGLEFGLTSKYAITKNVKLRAGMQFNLSRYNIQASKHNPELAILSLNNGRSGVQSVSTMSTYRNSNGNQADWIENFYFQLSTPIGAEVKLGGNDKVYIGAAGTVQPTYVLGDKSYLLTTDYKNYAQVPWLMRRWNVNTNLETFVAYSSGKLKWQVGPQVRYQLLSSFENKYPVKENLFDFGLKVGISVNPSQ